MAFPCSRTGEEQQNASSDGGASTGDTHESNELKQVLVTNINAAYKETYIPGCPSSF